MERKINTELLKWKRDPSRKPFLLYGSRQVGKTFSIVQFGREEYKNIAYFDTFNNVELLDILKKEKTLDKIILKLSILSGESIFKDDTLIVFDNISDIEIIKGIKLFNKNGLGYHTIMITSLRELVNKTKGEELHYKGMYTIDFEEYLLNSDKKQLIDFIKDSFVTNSSMPFHQIAMDMYNDYLMTGGFPEVVNAKLNNSDYIIIESIKQKIIDIYKKEISSTSNLIDITRGNEIYDSIGNQLLKDNKKFQYGLIRKGSRSKDYESSINTLTNNLVINRSYKVNDIKSPLSSCRDMDSFKLYLNDTGLLYTLMHLSKVKFMTDDDVRRTLIENNVANTLINMGNNLYYYQSDGKAEVTFVIQNRMGKIIPIEVVNMNLTKAKALSMFLKKYNIKDSIRLTDDNFSRKKGMKYIPIYASFCMKEL